MNTPNTSSAPINVKQSRRRFLLLAAFFFVPLAVSFLLYYGDLWRPEGGTNKGNLITPARPLPEIALTLSDGTQSTAEVLRNKWSWVYIGDGQCDARCQTALADTKQARLLLSEKIDRVQRVFLVTGNCCDNELLKREHPGLIVALFDKPEFISLFTIDGTAPQQAGRIYLVDPLGNLMMSYEADAPNVGLLADIKKLLKLSHIG